MWTPRFQQIENLSDNVLFLQKDFSQVLAESVSDMLNTEFSKSVSEILETCGERLAAGGSKLCPPPEVFSSFVFCSIF